MSLVAALLIGSSAFALDNIKVSGDANLYYQTTDGASGYDKAKGRKSGDLFSKDSSAADASLNLNITADVLANDLVSVSAGAGYTVLTTLGLENNLVSNVWGGAHTGTAGTGAQYANLPDVGGAKVENASWMNEAWIAATAGKTTAKIGRMALDTPLAFTETWSAEQNTFEAIVVVNQDIPNTTLVGAYIGNGNGTENFGQNAQSNVQGLGLATAPVVNGNGKFTTYGQDGAYGAGVINNSIESLTLQAWYYDVTRTANAYWLQADLDASSLGVKGLILGAQYSGINVYKTVNVDGTTPLAAGNKDVSSGVFAVMAGYAVEDMATIKLAYSSVDKDHSAGFNTATNAGTAQSKLYTEAWWNYGHVTLADTQAYNVTVTSPVNGLFDLGLYYTYADQAKATDAATPGAGDMTEFTTTAGKSFGPLDLTAAYIYTDFGKAGGSNNTVQVYASVNF